MPYADYTAANTVRNLREAAGFNSPEELEAAIRVAAEKGAPWAHRGTVNAWTIRKIEEGHVPGARIRYVLSSYFKREPSDPIWETRNWEIVETSIALAKKKATS